MSSYYCAQNAGDEAECRTNDLNMTWVLVCTALYAKREEGDATGHVETNLFIWREDLRMLICDKGTESKDQNLRSDERIKGVERGIGE